MKWKSLTSLAGELISEWSSDNVMRLSAALAYYSIFSLAPLLVIMVSILSLTLGQDAARGQIGTQLTGLFGAKTGEMIQTAIAATYASKTAGILAAITGTVTLLLGASTVFGELKNALNTIWGVSLRPGTPVRTVFRGWLLSFSLVFGIGALFLLSLTLTAVLSALNGYPASVISLPPVLLTWADFLLSFLMTSLLFAFIFKILPDVVLSLRDVAFSAVVTALLFTIGKTLLAWYLGTNAVGSAFGAAGALLAVLFWVYYMSCILFLGAEIGKLCVKRFGSGVVPNRYAMLVGEAARLNSTRV